MTNFSPSLSAKTNVFQSNEVNSKNRKLLKRSTHRVNSRRPRASISAQIIFFTFTCPLFIPFSAYSSLAIIKGSDIFYFIWPFPLFRHNSFYRQVFCAFIIANLSLFAETTFDLCKAYSASLVFSIVFCAYFSIVFLFIKILFPFFSKSPIEMRTFKAS